MRSIVSEAVPGVVAPLRMVWLPGAFQGPEDFLRAGFDTEARKRGLAIDLQFVEVELEHVGDRSVIENLSREIVAPARAAGCRAIWLAGISLGGLFALDYAATRAGECDGLCLFAPYLGNRQLIAEIAAAPGIAAWEPGPLAQSDEERRIWRFVRDCRGRSGCASTPPVFSARPLYLGYGREDRFAQGHALMAEALAPDMVDVVEGGHDWPTWCTLWERFLTSKFP
jgi:pimeloyl-ACP methyl ester carboxylesterase